MHYIFYACKIAVQNIRFKCKILTQQPRYDLTHSCLASRKKALANSVDQDKRRMMRLIMVCAVRLSEFH